MQLLMVWHFAGALAVLVSCLALIIGKLHIIERAEIDEWLKELKEKAIGTQ